MSTPRLCRPPPTQHPLPSTLHRRKAQPGSGSRCPRSPRGRRGGRSTESRSSAPPLYRAEFAPGHSLSSIALARPGVDTVREAGVVAARPSPVLELCRMRTLQLWELWRPRRGLPQGRASLSG